MMELGRRAAFGGLAALVSAAAQAQPRRLFDSHCHIIDHRFPIIPAQGYTPPHFPIDDYLAQTRPLGVTAGAVVSGSFQGNDQTYLMDVLPKLGPNWVGVTQIPNGCPGTEIHFAPDEILSRPVRRPASQPPDPTPRRLR